MDDAASVLTRAHEVWPRSWIPDQDFLSHVQARRGDVTEIAVSDLYLACACARGVPEALAAFSRQILAEVPAHVATFDRSPAFVDEVRQLLATKLLVAAPGSVPKIADYAGAAPLSAWVRIAAIRVALNLRRGRASEPLAPEVAQPPPEIEQELLRARWGAAFEGAIAHAMTSLTRRERNLLRLRVVDGLAVDQIATIYQVHRATVTRWFAACRERVLTLTRGKLTAEFGLDSAELDSLTAVVQSRLDLSIARLLGSQS